MSDASICIERRTCRICGSKNLVSVLDLGAQFIASQFVGETTPPLLQKPYPLELVRCAGESSCGLIQLHHSLASSLLYVDYGYQSGINQTMRSNLREIAQKATEIVDLGPGYTQT